MVEVGGVAGMPFAEAIVELELHEMASDGGDEHVATLAADGEVELEDAIVAGAAITRPQTTAGVREDLGHRFCDRGLLGHV